MQESKIDSTLKIGIEMRQVEGDTNFTAPILKMAMVFGEITGVLSAEAGDEVDDSGGHMQSITSKTRELSGLEDMYRRTFAVSWSWGSDELPPDELIEDLFAGGDGGAMKPAPVTAKSSQQSRPRQDDETGGDSASVSETDSKRTIRNRFLTPNAAGRRQESGKGESNKTNGWRSPSRSAGNVDGPSPTSSPCAKYQREAKYREADASGREG